MAEPTATASAEALSWVVRFHPGGGSAEARSDWNWCCSATRAGDAVYLYAAKDPPTPTQWLAVRRLLRDLGFRTAYFERAKGARPGWHEIDLTKER